MKTVTATFHHKDVHIRQYQYPKEIQSKESDVHDIAIMEYSDDIYIAMLQALEATKANITLYSSQPDITPSIRLKLVDFALKLLIRLKMLPFVFYQGIQIFDRYCLSQIVLLSHAHLAVTTCLWIAAKVGGGNNHFANLDCPDIDDIKTITDLGHGSGARFLGPTERFRHPRLNELVRLCGSKHKYDASMFVQMELHILTALHWNFTVPCISDYIVSSADLQLGNTKNSTNTVSDDGNQEMYRIKRFIAYASCYLFELVNYTALEVATVMLDLINDSLLIQLHDPLYQSLNISTNNCIVDYATYYHIRRHLEHAIRNSSTLLFDIFDTRGPRLVHSILCLGPETKSVGSPLSRSVHSSTPVAGRFMTNYTYVSSGNESIRDLSPVYNESSSQYANQSDYPTDRDFDMTTGGYTYDEQISVVPKVSKRVPNSSQTMLQTPEEDEFSKQIYY